MRYAHQPWSEVRDMTRAERQRLYRITGWIVAQENGKPEEAH